MIQKLKRPRGAPRGNQNARKHGFYSSLLTNVEQSQIKKAALLTGLDDEINLLRVKIRAVIERDPDNIRLISQAAISLARLLRAKHALPARKEDTLRRAMENIIKEAIPLGFDVVEHYKDHMDRNHDIVDH